jgi:large subunit ribosomal protein L16
VFEVSDVPEDVAKDALRLGMHKLPIKCKIVSKESNNDN